MMKPEYRFLALLAIPFALLTGQAAQAAQDAMVTVEQAPIRERPNLEAKIIESMEAGRKIRVSNYNKDGWYKTRATTGQYGWVWQGDLAVLTYSGDVKAATLELKEKTHERRSLAREPWLFWRAGGFLFGLISPDVSGRLGAGGGHWYFTPGGFTEIAFRIEERLRFAIRFGAYSGTSSVTFFDEQYDVTHDGMPLLGGLDADITRGEVFDVAAGFYGGISLSNKLSVVAAKRPVPNSFSLQETNLAILVDFTFKRWFSRWFAVVFDVGLYYSQIQKTTIPNGFFGDGPFRDNPTTLSTIRVSHVGPIFGLAAQFAF